MPIFSTPFININRVEIFQSKNFGQSYESKGFALSPATQFVISNVNEITDDNRISNYSFEEDLGQWELVTTISGEGILSRSAISPQEGQYSAFNQ